MRSNFWGRAAQLQNAENFSVLLDTLETDPNKYQSAKNSIQTCWNNHTSFNDENKTYRSCGESLYEIFNATVSFQAVSNKLAEEQLFSNLAAWLETKYNVPSECFRPDHNKTMTLRNITEQQKETITHILARLMASTRRIRQPSLSVQH